ncbi:MULTISPECIES: heavy-metal-associated domain-containing protein [Flavobacterium]|uniref:heavy-metal-associated domain-containing protein n=1 Tax=Flavobacterium TaxID=237 RepID=UPI0006AB7A16|nr:MULTISPECIES: heavy-metal-associated domain-containing protein [Flavobacterium]KOP40199.1 metal transporter [Flavobacterium sp. VMW]MCD9573525.1 heavy-metal-associated domain-containing protein [Flavobacterium soyae]OWU91413.1 metal transporter [Flavobacterium sp. NLM]
MKNLILIAMITFLGFSAQAQTKKNKNLKYTVEVNGNCEQCKKRIEKAAFGVPGVKTASWDISTHQLTVILNEEKSSPQDLNAAIAKVGHDTKEVKAADADYENLHSCCKYEREK